MPQLSYGDGFKLNRSTSRTEATIATGAPSVGTRVGGVQIHGLRCAKALRVPVPAFFLDMGIDEARGLGRELIAAADRAAAAERMSA